VFRFALANEPCKWPMVNGQRCVVRGQLIGQHHARKMVNEQRPSDRNFNNKIRLKGARISEKRSNSVNFKGFLFEGLN
jgi:hypothetical protein